ncbi:MAG: alpha/beta hydrolase [Flavobacteriia bacterium]|nr:MAG: alpha/beta hydrolase [Flavobacteriia bacterium]
MKYPVFLVLFFISLTHSTTAQNKIIKLWPDGVPGSVSDPSYFEKTEVGSDNIKRIFRVTDPELIVFPASKENASGAAVLICPGGGYKILAIDHEGYSIARWLNKIGITAFVLKYRLPSDLIMKDKKTGPLADAKRAIRMIRDQAEKWNIDPDKIGVMGFSAGGHLASSLSTHYNDSEQDKKQLSARPDFSLLIYPVISMEDSITHLGSRTNLLGEKPARKDVVFFSNDQQVTKDTPPAFLVHAADDKVVPVQNSINYFMALNKFHIPAEIHIYEKGGHGFGIKNLKGTVANWPEDCEHWLRSHQLIK